MVAFNTTTYVWSWTARSATSTNRASAIAWMETLPAIESHCLLEAGLTTLSIANGTRSASKRMLFIGNRPPFCWGGSGGGFGEAYVNQCLNEITSSNVQNIPLDTVFYPEFPDMGEEVFWQQLAAQNQGSFKLAE